MRIKAKIGGGSLSAIMAALRSEGVSDELMRAQIDHATRTYPVSFAMSMIVSAGVILASRHTPNLTTIVGAGLSLDLRGGRLPTRAPASPIRCRSGWRFSKAICSLVTR